MSKEKTVSAAAEETKAQLPATTSASSANKLVVGSMVDDMESMAGAGMENVRVGTDTLIPRIGILQALSAQLKRNKPDSYIEGAKVGDICDLAMKELLPTPMIFIPVFFMTQYLEWKPDRKGLAGIHNDASILTKCTPNEKGQPVLANGNLISETAQFFGLNASADYRVSYIGMTSTQLKKARYWNTLSSTEKALRRDGSEFTPPLFYRSYELGTVPESKDDHDWVGWTITRGQKIEDMEPLAAKRVFDLAKSIYEAIKQGRAKADLSSLQEEDDKTIEGNHATKPM